MRVPPTITDDLEACPRPANRNKCKQYASSLHKDVSESDPALARQFATLNINDVSKSGQHRLGTSESDYTIVHHVAIRKEQDVSESDQHLVGASESDRNPAHNMVLRKYTEILELNQHLTITSEFDHTLARNDASGRKTSIKVSDISNVCLLPVPWSDGYGL